MPNKPEQGRGRRRSRTFSRETNLQRSVNTREEHRSVLIVTNGKSTEFDYFEALRQEPWVTAHKVLPKFDPGAPDAIVLRAAKIRDESAYDEAWVVCDADEFDVKTAMSVAYTYEIGLALSVPSFEVWLILHLSEGCPGFNNATQAGEHLKKLLSSWSKTSLRYSDFSGGVFSAVVRAKRLGEPPGANPATAVWRLIESLRTARESLRRQTAVRTVSCRRCRRRALLAGLRSRLVNPLVRFRVRLLVDQWRSCSEVPSRAVLCLVKRHAELLRLLVPGVQRSLVVLPKFSPAGG